MADDLTNSSIRFDDSKVQDEMIKTNVALWFDLLFSFSRLGVRAYAIIEGRS